MIIASHVKKSENKFPSETARKGAFEYAVFLNMAKKRKIGVSPGKNLQLQFKVRKIPPSYEQRVIRVLIKIIVRWKQNLTLSSDLNKGRSKTQKQA